MGTVARLRSARLYWKSIVEISGIRLKNIHRLDLNLLVTLDALLAERHVTRAARRLNLSQPAVSIQLAKLREAFGDPLLVAGPRGMLATTRADALREPLRDALDGLRRAVSPGAAFDPATATHTWTIAATDHSAVAVVLPVIARLRAAAPLTRLAVVEAVPPRLPRQAQDGEIDIGLHTMDMVAPGLHAQALFTERYVLVGRKGHPRLRRRPTLAQFCAMEHVVVSPDGGGFSGATDTALAALGLARQVMLSLPHFNVVRATVASTDLVAMLPWRLVRAATDLQVSAAPLDVPGYELGMFWHERRHRDPAHQWLRAQIAAAVAA